MSNQRLIDECLRMARRCNRMALTHRRLGSKGDAKTAISMRNYYMLEARQLKADACI